MKKFRVTIETDYGVQTDKYSWTEVYQQELTDLNLAEVVVFLNTHNVQPISPEINEAEES